jgi:hypothetical protein
MNISYTLQPNLNRTKMLDKKMRAQLIDSLAYLKQSIAEQWKVEFASLNHTIKSMQSGSIYPPSTFGIYYELAFALFNGDESEVELLMAELATEKTCNPEKFSIVGLSQVSPKNLLRYQKLMNSDPQTNILITALNPDREKTAITSLASSLGRFKILIPEMYDEFLSLVKEIILVGSDKENSEFKFDGGSCYMLWGGLFINAENERNDVTMIEALVHESSHSLLFSYSIDEPLVRNEDNELFSSPLRDDLRPMDGIYHATFVSARMYWAMNALIQSGNLNADEILIAQNAKNIDCQNFFSGYAIVKAHADLTETGLKIMSATHDYMKNFK